MAHELHINQKTSMTRHAGLGYDLRHPQEAMTIATGVAADLVREALEAGALLRVWVIETKSKTHYLLKLGDHISSSSMGKGELKSILTQALADVVFWETEISHSIRSYFSKISDLMGRLKVLNPPLRSDQIDPYVEVILADRRSTMATLEPLSDVIEKIAKLKTKCWMDPVSTVRRSS